MNPVRRLPDAALLPQVKRWLACRRGSVALENALATIPLMLCLTGMFEIVQTIFAGDLVKRAAYRVARTNALAAAPASDATAMESRIHTGHRHRGRRLAGL